MEGVLSIFQSFACSDNEYLDIYLSAFDDHQAFRLKTAGGIDGVVQHISSALSKPQLYRQALILLNCYLKQASYEVLEQKAILWTTLTLKAVNSNDVNSIVDLVYPVLSSLALNSLRVPEVSKSFAHNHLQKIYESLSKNTPLGYSAALKCTEVCLRLYPGPSGPFRGSVDKFLTIFIDTPDEALNIWSGKCMHLLQQVRGGGVQGMSHKASWMNYQQKLIASLHNILDLAFSNCNDMYETPKENDNVGLYALELDDEPTKRAAQLFIRFRNLVNYLIIAIKDPFPVAKSMTPKKILNLISRGLSVTCPILQKNPISDNLALGTLLPTMHICLLKLLKTLIFTLRSNLKVHHLTILGFVVETLHWTSSKTSGSKKPLIALRSKAYEILSLWCTTMHNGSRVEMISDTLIEEVFYDILPFQNEFTLKVLSGAKKHMSKKIRRQLQKAQNEQSNLSNSYSHNNGVKSENLTDEGNQEVCVSALRSLQKLFISASNFLKPTVIKTIQLKIVQICGVFYALSRNRQQLYYNWECRLEIYKLMQIFIVQTHHLCPPPTQMIFIILQKGQIYDDNRFVRLQCADALMHMEKIIHPQKENLLFPCDIRQTYEMLGNERIIMSAIYDGQNQNELHEKNCKMFEQDEELLADLTCKSTERLSPPDDLDDSVGFVENIIVDNDVCKNIDLSIQKKSPELFLRVDEDDNESEEPCFNEIRAVSNEIKDDASLSPPVPKKQRLEPQDKFVDIIPIPDSKNQNINVDCADDILAEIESTFVDELN